MTTPQFQCYPHSQRPFMGTCGLYKASSAAEAASATHSVHTDQASHAAERRLIPPLPLPCSLARSVTTPLQGLYLLCDGLLRPRRTPEHPCPAAPRGPLTPRRVASALREVGGGVRPLAALSLRRSRVAYRGPAISFPRLRVNRGKEKGRSVAPRPGRCFLNPLREASRSRRRHRCG